MSAPSNADAKALAALRDEAGPLLNAGAALANAVALWAGATTAADSPRAHDLRHDKVAALLADGAGGAAAGFFVFARKRPHEVTPHDVAAWRTYLEEMGLAAGTVYARVSRLSSFYRWLGRQPGLADVFRHNPVNAARPRAPLAYQNERAQALTDEDAAALLAAASAEAATGALHGLRDVALLRLFFATGARRSELLGLRLGDVRLARGVLLVRAREKGGLYRAREVRDPAVRAALIAYVRATERWDDARRALLGHPRDPLWLRHDRAAGGAPLAVTSHGFVKMFKLYARRAGLGDVHLHQTRHTVARIVGEEAGDLTDVQSVLGHQHLRTTRVYLRRVQVLKDKFSTRIARRLRGG